MIKLYSSNNGKTKNITMFCKEIQWSGDKAQCARKLDITVVYPMFDTNQPLVLIELGTFVCLLDAEAGPIFMGIVFNREINSDQTLKFTAYDFLIYFLKSKASYNFTNTTPENIAEKLCSDFNVEIGSIEKTGVTINNMLVQSKSLYEIIMEAYSYASNLTGKQYIPTMDGNQFNVIEKGKNLIDFTLDPSLNLISSTYSDNIDNMVNKIKIYDESGEFTGDVAENTAWQKSYGIIQDIFEGKKDTDSKAQATGLLKGVEMEAAAEVLGNVKVTAGCAVKTNIFYVDNMKEATWYVDADTHSWEIASGKYKMQLTLNYENIMDVKTGDVNNNSSNENDTETDTNQVSENQTAGNETNENKE